MSSNVKNVLVLLIVAGLVLIVAREYYKSVDSPTTTKDVTGDAGFINPLDFTNIPAQSTDTDTTKHALDTLDSVSRAKQKADTDLNITPYTPHEQEQRQKFDNFLNAAEDLGIDVSGVKEVLDESDSLVKEINNIVDGGPPGSQEAVQELYQLWGEYRMSTYPCSQEAKDDVTLLTYGVMADASRRADKTQLLECAIREIQDPATMYKQLIIANREAFLETDLFKQMSPAEQAYMREILEKTKNESLARNQIKDAFIAMTQANRIFFESILDLYQFIDRTYHELSPQTQQILFHEADLLVFLQLNQIIRKNANDVTEKARLYLQLAQQEIL